MRDMGKRALLLLIAAGAWLAIGCQVDPAAPVSTDGSSPSPTPSAAAAPAPAAEPVVAAATPAQVAAAPVPPPAPLAAAAAPIDSADPASPPPFEGKKLALVHTANVIGELEPCG